MQAAGIDTPTYIEGQSLLPYLNDEPIQPREFVFCEDNYQVMMRSQSHKLVYYIGQESGELYDLTADPHELDNLWDRAEAAEMKGHLLGRLLAWLSSSVYYNAGYRQNRARHYSLRWPSEGNAHLHGSSERPKQVAVF